MTGARRILLGATAALACAAVCPRAVHASEDLWGHHYNIGASFSPGYPDSYKITAAIAGFNTRTRLGIGTSIEYLHGGAPYTVRGDSSWWATYPDKTDKSWDMWRVFAVNLYYVPFLGGHIYSDRLKGIGGENAQSALYLYASLCPWATISDEYTDYGYYGSLSVSGVSAHEFGIGYSLGKIMDLKLGYMTIKSKAVNDGDVNFPAYKHEKVFLGVDLYYGGWFSPAGAEEGWLPAVRNAAAEARERRENARPAVRSFSPKKPVLGSSMDIYGANFRRAENKTAVLFNGVPGEVTALADDRLSVRVPGNIPAGFVNFRVRTTKGSSEEQSLFVAPSKPPLLTVSDIGFADKSGDRILEADEEGEIFFTISNAQGAGKAFGLKLEVGSRYLARAAGREKTALSGEKTYEIGDLEGGGSIKYSVPVKSGLDLRDGGVIFNMRMAEMNDFAPDPFEVKIETRRLEPPDLRLAKIEVDDTFEPDRSDKLSVGNGNSVIEPGESVEIAATLVNRGAGLSKCAGIRVVNESPDIALLTPAELRCGDLKPGEWMDLRLAFSVKKGYRGGDALPLKLALTEVRERFDKELPLDLKLRRSYPKTELVAIKGKARDKKPVVMPSFGEELLDIPSARNWNKEAVAVVVGVQNYKNRDVPSVAYALNDARLFREYLTRALGYREGNIILLEDPTKADLEKVFGTDENPNGQLADYVKKGKSDVFVYYTGHGAPDPRSKQAYLVPSDADPDYVKLGGYPLGVFYDNLARLPARRVSVVLDTCFSGQSAGGTIISRASPLRVEPVIPGSGRLEIFSSSRADEISSWYPEKRHSLFTYFFLRGLQGEADLNKDRVITAAELEEYLGDNVEYMARRLHGRRQSPVFVGLQDNVIAAY